MKKCGEANQRFFHYNIGSEVAMQRQQLVEEALETSTPHIFYGWIVTRNFPDILNRLLAHKKDVVACNYSTRAEPLCPLLLQVKEIWKVDYIKQPNSSSVFAVGLGCMLVNTDVSQQNRFPYFS